MIYFISDDRGHVKIGYTGDFDCYYRLRMLQTGNPFRLRVLATIDGDYADEKALQSRFSRYLTREDGEWFYLREEFADFILGVVEPGTQVVLPLGERRRRSRKLV